MTDLSKSRSATKIGIAVVKHGDQYLVGTRSADSPLAGMAEFPGGKCEPNESPAECAARECFEEAGLEVQAVRLLDQRTHEYPHGVVELHFWLCEPLDIVALREDHNGFRWVDRGELTSLNFPDANVKVVSLLVGEKNL